MTSVSRQLAERAERIIPGGVNSATRAIGAPWAWSSAQGATITDLDGRSYTDYHAAFGAICSGTATSGSHGRDPRHGGHRPGGCRDHGARGGGSGLIVDAIPSAEMVITTMSESTFERSVSRGATGRYILKFQGASGSPTRSPAT